MIQILGLGPGDKNSLTLGAVETLKKSKHIFLRTEKHPVVEYLKTLNVKYKTYDDKYNSSESFDDVYKSIGLDIIDKHKEYGNLVYAVPGHPLVAEKSVNIIINLCKEQNIQFEIIPAVSFVDSLIESLKIDPIDGVKIINAFDINNEILDKRTGVIITQVYDKFIASEVKLALAEYYDDEDKIFFVRAAGIKGMESIREIPIYELDRQEDIDYLTSLYIPKNLGNTKDFYDLKEIIKILRSENGCPWDRKQTHSSLKPFIIEECYEVIEAIEKNNDNMLIEELGDVLLQVMMHSQIGEEEGFFNINDVIENLCNKMIERHPHVFSDIKVKNSEEVLSNWDEIKNKQQKHKTYTDILNHIPKNLPALMRANKVQGKAAKVGFDFETVDQAFDKLIEEMEEVKSTLKSNNVEKTREEIGDLIFTCVNIARLLDIDPEFALNYTIDKFIKRFEYIEKMASLKGFSLEELNLRQMDKLWNEAKLNP